MPHLFHQKKDSHFLGLYKQNGYENYKPGIFRVANVQQKYNTMIPIIGIIRM